MLLNKIMKTGTNTTQRIVFAPQTELDTRCEDAAKLSEQHLEFIQGMQKTYLF